MACNANIPWLARSRRSGNPSYRVVQGQTVCPVKKRSLKPDF
jgi:hypothetical protein